MLHERSVRVGVLEPVRTRSCAHVFTRQRRLRAPTLPARYHVIDWAIEYGTLEIYDFLASKIELHHAHHFVGGRPCASAARVGNASMLRRLFDRGFAVDQLALRCVVQGFDGLNGYDGVPEAEGEAVHHVQREETGW